MRKAFGILGALLISVIILISGSAVARWVYGQSIYDSDNTTNELEILKAPNDVHATLGNASGLGWIAIDMSAGNGLPPDTDFTVFASFGYETEDYDVSMSEDMMSTVGVGSGDDSDDQVFTSPSTGTEWRYIILTASSGSTSVDDPIQGPEIDAVGWDKP